MSVNNGAGMAGTLKVWSQFSSRRRSSEVSSSGRTGVAVAPHDPLGRRQFGQTHRSASMQFLGGDSDLSAETELFAVGEGGGCVDHHRRGIDPLGEPLCRSEIHGRN